LKKNLISVIALVIVLVFFTRCDNDEPEQGKGQLTVNVRELANNNTGIRANVFLDDSLYGTTDTNGLYMNNSVNSGNYTLTCSAIDFRDTVLKIKIISGENTKFDFYLTSTKGKVFGEFQDMYLFRQETEIKPEIKTWDEKQVYDGTTGATICYKFIQNGVPERSVSIGDSIITVSDGFGQYYFKIQCGTYTVTGTCEGYVSSSKVIRVLPDSKIYVNFNLERK
jgi:hypothetical protein